MIRNVVSKALMMTAVTLFVGRHVRRLWQERQPRRHRVCRPGTHPSGRGGRQHGHLPDHGRHAPDHADQRQHRRFGAGHHGGDGPRQRPAGRQLLGHDERDRQRRPDLRGHGAVHGRGRARPRWRTSSCSAAGSATNGSVAINGRLDQCPYITGLSATALQAPVGGSITVGVSATELDPGDTITYSWTNSAPAIGTLAPTNAATGDVHLHRGRAARLSIAVSDGVCGDSL